MFILLNKKICILNRIDRIEKFLLIRRENNGKITRGRLLKFFFFTFNTFNQLIRIFCEKMILVIILFLGLKREIYLLTLLHDRQ